MIRAGFLRAGHRVRSRAGAALVAVALAAALLPINAVPASAIVAPGPVDPAHGFPVWYEDENGLRLELCLEQTAMCLLEAPNPDQPISFPDNFGGEAFWWAAEAATDAGDGGSALLVLAMEAAFLNEEPVDGDQMSFGRVRIRLRDVDPNTEYTVTHPYGVDTVTTDGEGETTMSEDIGCLAGPCNFAKAKQSRVAPFLVWDPAVEPAAPAGFVGDPAVEHSVVGSPHGTNFFRVEGPNIGGAGVDVIETDQFTVMGKILGASRPALAPESDTGAAADDLVTNANSVIFTGFGPPDAAVKVLVDGKAAGQTEVDGGLYSVTIDDLAEGTHEISAAANDASAPSSPLTVTVDRTAPGISAMGMEPATFDTAEQKSATLTAEISEEADVAAEVMDADGTMVRELPAENAAGTITATWDGMTAAGDPAASGSYEVVITATDMAGNVSSEAAGVELAAATIPDSGDDGSSTVIWIIVGAVLALAVVITAVRAVRRRGAEPQEL